MLSGEVVKRDLLEGEKAQDAVKKIARATNRALRAKAEKDGTGTEAPILESNPESPTSSAHSV